MTLLAYHADPSIKGAILAELEAHRAADEIIKGQYWAYGKGCAVGCTIKSGNHVEYEARFGIPEMLAQLEDVIFEGLPNASAMAWPIDFISAIQPGANLSRVGWQFQNWLLTNETVNPGINHPLVRDAVAGCAALMQRLASGILVEPEEASAAESAVWSAASAARAERSAVWSAASAARAAESAVWGAASAASAWSAESAARSAAWSAASAARAAESAVWSAASAARAWSAESAARSAAFSKMATKLLELLAAAPMEASHG